MERKNSKILLHGGASFSKCPENFCFKVADFSFVVLKII